MKLPILHTDQSHLTDHDLQMYEHKLKEELGRMQYAAGGLYEDDRASINLPLDKEHIKRATELAKKYKDASLVVVVGIGGSNLGTIAVQEAVLGKLHNLSGKRPRMLYADTVDPDTISSISAQMEQELRKKKQVVLNIVTKKGTTIETVANFLVLLQTLQKHRKDFRKYVVVTTDENSVLWELAQREHYTRLAIPAKVGGRYSVFSLVGLFPLALAGIDIKKLLDGAAHMRALCLQEGHKRNPAIIRAAMLAHEWAHGHVIADNFYFRNDLESVGKWYRQLMGESIGKEWNKDHSRRQLMGITPTVSIGSTDLHSMAQLYFGGPHDKFFSIVTTHLSKSAPSIPHMARYQPLAENIQGRKLSEIMQAISEGVKRTLEHQRKPYCHIELADGTEESIGALLQLHMMEMMYLAELLDVNPFDQPNVEEYKNETKKILAHKK
jgi:glucose-6-phosphate isomerase